MDRPRFEWRIGSPMALDTVDLYLFDRQNHAACLPLGKVMMKKFPEGDGPGAPTLSFSGPSCDGILHALARALWESGYRVGADPESRGKLEATERHLRDMQDIAFRFMPKKEEPTQ